VQLAILIAVILALAQVETSAAGPTGGTIWRAALTMVGVLVAPLAAALGSMRLLRDLAREERLDPTYCERVWSQVQSIALGLWLAIVVATLYVLKWPQVVRSDWSLAAWPLADELVILLPVLAPLVLLWCVLHRLHTAAHRSLARGQDAPRPQPPLMSFLWQNARHHLALAVLPALAVIGWQETVVLVWPGASRGGFWVYLPTLAGMLILLPLALRYVWRTSPLPAGPLRERLTAICRAQRVGVREILVWHTDFQVANAAVAGVVRGMRYVFLTDGLLARLSPAEVEAVLRHELGHIAGRHMLWRLLLLAWPLAMWMAAQQACPEALAAISYGLTQIGLAEPAQMTLLVPLALAAYAIVVVGTYSRWLEHDADLSTCVWPGGQVDRSAAEAFARALLKIVGPARESFWSLWLHPPAITRVTVLARAIGNPAWAAGFRRRLAWVALAIATLYLLAAVMLLVRP
jgi:STE24 endopeptidase